MALFTEEPRRAGCVACGQPVYTNNSSWCENCWPPICVCPIPDPDSMGECRKCLMGYTPALMQTRDRWIAYLDGKGVKRGFVLAGN